MPSSFSLLRSSFLLVLTLIMLLDSRKISQDDNEAFLGRPYHLHIISTPLEANAGPGEDTPTFPQVEATFLMDYKMLATRVWPRVILDYTRHQLRFKGRTKKAQRKDIFGGSLSSESKTQ